MNSKLGGLALFGLVIGAVVGGVVYFAPQFQPKKEADAEAIPRAVTTDAPRPVPAIQQELNDLSAKMVAQLKADDRLNLSMVAQLRAYDELLGQIEGYAAEIERNLDIIEEISQDEFQQDVQLQAKLYSGKKPDVVAKHLEEFRAARVGAILSKMKDKEASAVLDIWAERKDPKVSSFYREVMAAYLNNKRRDANPELFNKLLESSSKAPKTGAS